MTKAEKSRVVQFLYSIQKNEWAAENISKELSLFEERILSGSKVTPSYSEGSSGGESDTKQESYVLLLERYQERKSMLLEVLAEHRRKINDYYSTIDKMVQLEDWGSLARDICREKYYRHRTPDVAIYSQLFCPSATYYRTLNRLQQFFYDVLIARFK